MRITKISFYIFITENVSNEVSYLIFYKLIVAMIRELQTKMMAARSIDGRKYPYTKIDVMRDFCTDVLLGIDF